MRKGYKAEYTAKKELIREFGEENVLKIAIGGAVDFLVLKPNKNRIEKIIEVKECHKNKYYPTPREREQFERLKLLGKKHSIKTELWIKHPRNNFIKKKLI